MKVKKPFHPLPVDPVENDPERTLAGSKVDGFVDNVRYRSLTVGGAMRPDKD